MKKSPFDVIQAPIITEQAMDAMEHNTYTFRVDKKANKAEIRQAVESAFEGVKVKNVNTINVKGKNRRMGMHAYKDPDWKKAIVTLTEDSEAIEFFEGM